MANGLYNQFKDLRTEQYRAIYDKPIYPKNQYLAEPPAERWLAREDATRRIDQFLAGAVRPGQVGELVAQRSRG